MGLINPSEPQPPGPSSRPSPGSPPGSLPGPAAFGSLAAADLAAALAAGSAALFPTDTLPAVAAQPAHAGQLWRLKGRPSAKPLILMGADAESLLAALEQPVLPQWRAMAARCWPGPITLVLPARGPVVAALQPAGPAHGSSLGLRIPASAPALELLRCSGPLATTSANRSGAPPCRTAEEAAAVFPEVRRLAPLPWPVMAGLASTVLRWEAEDHWRVLRAGAVMPEGGGASFSPA